MTTRGFHAFYWTLLYGCILGGAYVPGVAMGICKNGYIQATALEGPHVSILTFPEQSREILYFQCVLKSHV